MKYIKLSTAQYKGFDKEVTNRTFLSIHDFQPGRVVTLIEDKKGITWGCAYKVSGEFALKYLEQRECVLGGYETKYTKFFPRIASEFSGISGEAFSVVLYIATPTNIYWAGDDSLEIIAEQIVNASGPSGHNIEYLLRLAIFMRDEIQHAEDDHLFTLEMLVRKKLANRKVCIHTIMGHQRPYRIQRDDHEHLRRNITFAHSSRVPEKKLRCLNI